MTAHRSPVRAVGESVLRERTELATTQVSLEFARQPQVKDRLGDSARSIFYQDSQLQLSYLAAALFADSPQLFVDAVGWGKVALIKRGWDTDDLTSNLVCLCDALRFELPLETAEVAIGFVRDAIDLLPSLPDEIPPCIGPGQPHALLARLYLKALVAADLRAARRLILGAVDDGITVRDIYLNVLQPTMVEIGRLWQINELSVAREHFSAAATQSIMSLLHRHIVSDGEPSGRAIVTTCVAGDQHEIGVRMVADFFEMSGWASYFLGANTPTDSVISELIEREADVLGISATMAYHVPAVAELIQAIRRRPECDGVKILVGGHPFTLDNNLCSTVGADGEASDARHAVDRARRWFDS